MSISPVNEGFTPLLNKILSLPIETSIALPEEATGIVSCFINCLPTITHEEEARVLKIASQVAVAVFIVFATTAAAVAFPLSATIGTVVIITSLSLMSQYYNYLVAPFSKRAEQLGRLAYLESAIEKFSTEFDQATFKNEVSFDQEPIKTEAFNVAAYWHDFHKKTKENSDKALDKIKQAIEDPESCAEKIQLGSEMNRHLQSQQISAIAKIYSAFCLLEASGTNNPELKEKVHIIIPTTHAATLRGLTGKDGEFPYIPSEKIPFILIRDKGIFSVEQIFEATIADLMNHLSDGPLAHEEIENQNESLP